VCLLLPHFAEAVLQETVLQPGRSLPLRRIWSAVLLFPLLMPFFGGGAAELDSSSSAAATSASSTEERRAADRAADSQRKREYRAIAPAPPPIGPPPSRRARTTTTPECPAAIESLLRPHPGPSPVDPPQASSSSSSAAISASSTEERRTATRAATSQRVRDHRASSAVVRPIEQDDELPLRRPAPPIPAVQALQSQRARGASQAAQLPQGNSSGSSAAVTSASSTEVRRVAFIQHQSNNRASIAAAARARDQAIEASIMGSFAFTEAELKFAADNFEESPIAALAFLAANTGIANSPSDLGTLLDGVPDPAPLIAAFKRRTESPLHGCACCGMRSVQCRAINMLQQINVHKMTDAEQLEFAALPEAVRQVKSTCVIAGSRYLLHPELVHVSPGHMHSRTSLTSSHLSQGSFQTGILSRRICALLAQIQLVPLVEYIRCLFGQAAILATWPESVRHCKS
jgi:hypothetical protein